MFRGISHDHVLTERYLYPSMIHFISDAILNAAIRLGMDKGLIINTDSTPPLIRPKTRTYPLGDPVGIHK